MVDGWRQRQAVLAIEAFSIAGSVPRFQVAGD
jgi:hypothetical protein